MNLDLRSVLYAFLLSIAPSVCFSATAQVRGGEHGAFTRISVAMTESVTWSLIRTPDGYVFEAKDVSRFYLSEAFSRISRERLAGLTEIPPGKLLLRMECECVASALQVSPGLVAIDIRQGSEEAETAGYAGGENPVTETGSEGIDPAYRIPAARYDWLASGSPRYPWPMTEIKAYPSVYDILNAFRDSLMRSIMQGRGNAAFSVEYGPPYAASASAAPSQLAIEGGLPGTMPGLLLPDGPPATPDDAGCFDQGELNLTPENTEGAEEAGVARARAQLFGEFDIPQNAAILNGAKIYLAMGFGAEARQMLDLLSLPDGGQGQRHVDALRSISWLIDLEPAPQNAFADMAGCEGAAALWWALSAVLAKGDKVPPLPADFSPEALARAFFALPPALRRHLAPTLVSYLLKSGDEVSAYRLSEAAERIAAEDMPRYTLMKGELQLASGQAQNAAALARATLRDPRDAAREAALLQAEAAFAARLPLPLTAAEELAALRYEGGQADQVARLLRAEILAAALAGQFEHAFALSEQDLKTRADLWDLAVTAAGDDVFLAEALAETTAQPRLGLKAETALQLASRLMQHGFAPEARSWLSVGQSRQDPQARLLIAQSALHSGDYLLALEMLANDESFAAEGLRQAIRSQGLAFAAASRGSSFARLSEARQSAHPRAAIAPGTSVFFPDEGPLARGKRLAEEAGAAAAQVEALLREVIVPEG